MEPFVPPPYPPPWIDTDEPLPDLPVRVEDFVFIDVPPRPKPPAPTEPEE